MNYNCYRQTPANSFIRILHASPNTPSVDIYANGKLIVKNLAYTNFSQYFSVVPGNYNIVAYPAGQKKNPVLSTNLAIPVNSTFCVNIIGVLPGISLYPIPEVNTAQNSGRACIRFINLSPNAPAVDVILSDGTKVFSNVNYKEFTQYACMPPGTYTFQIMEAGTNNNILNVSNVQLMANYFYSIYGVGLFNGTPPLQAILALEGTPYSSQ